MNLTLHISSLLQHFSRQSSPKEPSDNTAEIVKEFKQLSDEFTDKVHDMGCGHIANYGWYHTIDLGDGLITPGCYDYRSVISAFKFPDSMEGMNVLDVGSGTGFFAFEFERRGANVTSVDVPSLADWDRFPGETAEHLRRKLSSLRAKLDPTDVQEQHALYDGSTLEKLYKLGIDGPFQFCRETLKSNVERRLVRIYDISKETVGRDDFDLVFIGDVLLHTVSPLEALAAASSVCTGTLVLAQDAIDYPDNSPSILYIGGDGSGEDDSAWFLPSKLCTEQWLRKLGFKNVSVVGEHQGVARPSGIAYRRAIFHAVR